MIVTLYWFGSWHFPFVSSKSPFTWDPNNCVLYIYFIKDCQLLLEELAWLRVKRLIDAHGVDMIWYIRWKSMIFPIIHLTSHRVLPYYTARLTLALFSVLDLPSDNHKDKRCRVWVCGFVPDCGCRDNQGTAGAWQGLKKKLSKAEIGKRAQRKR